MRIIRFRAWDNTKKYMSNPFNIWDVPYIINYNNIINEDIIVMQSTNVEDKNGKDIYEGDIVKINSPGIHDREHSIIEFLNGCFVESYYHYSLSKYPQYTIEIIGNIYENPELLK